jgi:hypothetical protein
MESVLELTKTHWLATAVVVVLTKIQTVEMVTMRYIIKEADYGTTVKE